MDRSRRSHCCRTRRPIVFVFEPELKAIQITILCVGPSSPKRRSLRSQPQKSTSNKDESSDEFVSKTSGRKELKSPVSSSKEAGSRAGGSKELTNGTSGSRAERTPRYSEVTRRFAARHRASSSSGSPPQPASPPRSAPTTRSRRLFNPNAIVWRDNVTFG